MIKNKRSFKQRAQEIIDVGGEGTTSTLSELFLEGVLGATVPGATSVIFSYKQKRMEQNFLRLLFELQQRVNDIESNYSRLDITNQQLVKDFFVGLVCDYVIDEQEEEKIRYIANGFVSLTGKEKMEIDQTIIFLDILKSLRLIDIRILFDWYKGNLWMVEFRDYLEELGIGDDEYSMIKEKLLRQGLLKSSFDDEYHKIITKVNGLVDFAMSLQKGKPKQLSSTFASFKPKDRETIKTSNLGRRFFEFFSGEAQ